MSENLYKEAFNYALNEIHKEYKNAGKENDFTLWFNMEYESDTINEITVSVASDFLKFQMQTKGNFDIVLEKIKKLTGQNQITFNISTKEKDVEEKENVSRENIQPLVSETEEK